MIMQAACALWLCTALVGPVQAMPVTGATGAPDSTALVQAFRKASRSKPFRLHAWLRSDMHYTISDPQEFIQGDLNGDGTADALVRFSVEGRNGGNNWDLHYAAFVKQGNDWKYAAMLDAGSSGGGQLLQQASIMEGGVTGTWFPAEGNAEAAYAVEYRLKEDRFITVYAGLQRVEQEGGEWLSVLGIVVDGRTEVPVTGTLQHYERMLGKGGLKTMDPQPECGTWFEEGTIRQLSYAQLQFEVNDKGKAAWMLARFGDGGIRLQTLHGTIGETTTLQDLTGLFKNTDSYLLLPREDGGTDFGIPDGEAADSQLRFTFNAAGKLMAAYVFIPC